MVLGELIYTKKSEGKKIEGYMDAVVVTISKKRMIYPTTGSALVFYSKNALLEGHEFH
jgi:hypothetical protein